MYGLIFFALLFSNQSFGRSAQSEAPITLPAIIKEGTPGDVLLQDPVSPALTREAKLTTASGSLQKSLSDELPLVVTGTGLAGNAAQFRGLGRSAEDTNVQALGVPLNAPQGGGFDLSVFPQFIWAGYSFQQGPALGTFDPRGTAGSLTLVPWTSQALATPHFSGRATESYSTARLNQVSVAASDGAHIAAVAGYSSGDARGPSGAFAARWSGGPATATFHLLATDLDASTPGPGKITPLAHQETIRIIPLGQVDWKLGSGALLKSSVFYDWGYLRYDDPGFSALPATQDRTRQYGTETALLLDEYTFGIGARHADYQTLGFAEQSESVLSLRASRTFELGNLLLDPGVRAVGVTDYGLLPEGNLGVRYELREFDSAVFARASYSRHFPSLVNRLYEYPGFPGFPGFKGNPALLPEKDWTLTMGGELKNRHIEASLQAFLQLAQDAQVRAPLNATTDTVINQGEARIASMTPSLTWHVVPFLDLGANSTFATSVVDQTGLPFPGLPEFVGNAWTEVHSPGFGEKRRETVGWATRVGFRGVSGAVADNAGNLLPAYSELTADARVRFFGKYTLAARVENILDQEIFVVQGFQSLGRTASFLVVGEL